MGLKALSFITIAFVVSVLPCLGETRSEVRQDFFPDDAFDKLDLITGTHLEGDFKRGWYEAQLAALNEHSIYSVGCEFSECFRFIWLRSFHDPISIRIEVSFNDEANLHFKQANLARSFDLSELELSQTKRLTSEDIAKIQALVINVIAASQSQEENFGFDGSQWVFEHRLNDVYTSFDRWTPTQGPLFELGLELLSMSNFDGAALEPIY